MKPSTDNQYFICEQKEKSVRNFRTYTHVPYIMISELLFSGVAQGVVTGIRGLCNGLGPALFGLIFYLFHVDLNEATDIDDKLNIKAHIKTNQTPEVRPGLTTKDVSELFILVHEIRISVVFTHARYFYLTYPYQP